MADVMSLRREAIANAPHLESASGSYASFETDIAAPLKECKVGFEPVQNMNGFSNPWIAGNGNNLMPPAQEGTITHNGITFTSNGKGIYTVKGTATEVAQGKFLLDESFIIPASDIVSLYFMNTQSSSAVTFRYYLDNVQVDSWSMAPLNRSTNSYVTMANKECNAYLLQVQSGVTVDMTISPMLLKKSVSGSVFLPYENICPIYGWGGNLIDFQSVTPAGGAYGFKIEINDGRIRVYGTYNNTNSRASFAILLGVPYKANTYVFAYDMDETAKKYFIGGGVRYTSTTYGGIALDLLNLEQNKYYDLSFKVVVSDTPDPGLRSLIFQKSNKNLALLSPEILSQTREQSGITWRAVSDSCVHISGTASGGSSFMTAGYGVNSIFMRTLTPGTYTISTNFPNTNPSSGYCYMYGYRIGSGETGTRTIANVVRNGTPVTFTLDKAHRVNIQMIVANGTTIDQDVWVQIERGSQATAYEEHVGHLEEYIPNDAMYAGTVNLLNGTVTLTHGYLHKNTADMNADEAWPGWDNSGVRALIGSGVNNRVMGAITNITALNVGYGCSGVGANTNGNGDRLMILRYYLDKSQTEWKELALEVQFVIPLAEPIVYQLTPQQLKSLRGQNNIWSDANGEVEVKYWTH